MSGRGKAPTPRGKAGAGRSRSSASSRGSGASRRRPPAAAVRRRRLAAGLVVSVLMVGFLLVAVFPTRTWLAQRSDTAAAERRLERIRAEEEAHEERIAELGTDEEVEHQAREDYGLVRPGETAYRVLPTGGEPVDLPDAWPFSGADDWLNR